MWPAVVRPTGRIRAALLLSLYACAPVAEKPRPAPTGRYEGTLTHRGAELPVVVSLYQDSASRAVQVLLRVAQLPLHSRYFDSVAYQAPTLTARLPGGSRMVLREEPNFLTGTVWLHDTLQAELVAVRRGVAEPPGYSLTRSRPANEPVLLRLRPADTVQVTGVVLAAEPALIGAAYGWADWLAAQGLAVVVAAPVAQPDSAAAESLAALLRQLRTDALVDSTRVGVWALGQPGRAAALVASARGNNLGFLLLQSAGFAPADRAWLRRLNRRPVLALYGAADTAVDVPASSRVLKRSIGGPSSGTKVYPRASRLLLCPAPTDSVRQWSQLPAELLPGLQQWLGELR